MWWTSQQTSHFWHGEQWVARATVIIFDHIFDAQLNLTLNGRPVNDAYSLSFSGSHWLEIAALLSLRCSCMSWIVFDRAASLSDRSDICMKTVGAWSWLSGQVVQHTEGSCAEIMDRLAQNCLRLTATAQQKYDFLFTSWLVILSVLVSLAVVREVRKQHIHTHTNTDTSTKLDLLTCYFCSNFILHIFVGPSCIYSCNTSASQQYSSFTSL